MRRPLLVLLAAGLLFGGLPSRTAGQIGDVLRQTLPWMLGGGSRSDDEDSKGSSAAATLALGLAAVGLGTAAASVIAQNTTIAVRQRGTAQGDRALGSIRTLMIGPTAGPVGRFVRWNVDTMVRSDASLGAAGAGVLADLGLAPPLLASVPGSGSRTVTLPVSASKLRWAELLYNCGNQPPRSVARVEAYAWAGVTPLTLADFSRIAWYNFTFPSGLHKNSRAFVEFRQIYYDDNYYELNSPFGAYVREHPLGHPDMPDEPHHECPHFHAVNNAKQERIINYAPESP